MYPTLHEFFSNILFRSSSFLVQIKASIKSQLQSIKSIVTELHANKYLQLVATLLRENNLNRVSQIALLNSIFFLIRLHTLTCICLISIWDCQFTTYKKLTVLQEADLEERLRTLKSRQIGNCYRFLVPILYT